LSECRYETGKQSGKCDDCRNRDPEQISIALVTNIFDCIAIVQKHVSPLRHQISFDGLIRDAEDADTKTKT